MFCNLFLGKTTVLAKKYVWILHGSTGTPHWLPGGCLLLKKRPEETRGENTFFFVFSLFLIVFLIPQGNKKYSFADSTGTKNIVFLYFFIFFSPCLPPTVPTPLCVDPPWQHRHPALAARWMSTLTG